MIYLDTSALVKLVRPEPECDQLRAWLDARSDVLLATSAIAEVELPRALRRIGEVALVDAADELLSDLLVIELDAVVRRTAAALSAPLLHSLDAIHIASAYELRPELTAIITYDDRMAKAVDETIAVASPGTPSNGQHG